MVSKEDISALLSTESYRRNYESGLDREASDGKTYRELIRSAPEGDADDSASATDYEFSMIANDAAEAKMFYNLMTGVKPTGIKVPKIKDVVHDALSNKDFPNIVAPAAELVIKNYVMPQILVSAQIFQRIPYTGNVNQVNVRAFGPIQIEEVGDNEKYPEVSSSIVDKAYRQVLSIKKYGAKLALDQELMDSDNWGILGFLLSQVGDGFILKEETQAIRLLNRMGTTIFDNKTPANSVVGKITSGRAIDGSFNGTINLDDMMHIHSYGNTRGFNYDTLLIHPFAWQMFVTNPELREIILQGSSTITALNNATKLMGSANPGFMHPFGEMWAQKMTALGHGGPDAQYGLNDTPDGWLGKLGASPASTTLSPMWATFQVPNSGWPGGLRVIVTPYVPIDFDNATKKFFTNLYFVDSRRTGVFLEREGVTIDEWDDSDREIHYIKFRRRYGIMPVYQGRGVAVARHIVIDRNYVFNNVNQVTLPVHAATSNVTGVTFP